MKNKNNIPEFDEFDFSDDKTLTEISEKYPVLSDMEKERIYKESEKKYEAMTGENDEGTNNKGNNSFQEIQYHTSKKSGSRRKFLKIAACLLITAGIVRVVVIPLITRDHQGNGPVPSPSESIITSAINSEKNKEVTNPSIQSQIPKKTENADSDAVNTGVQKQTAAELEEHMKNVVIPELIEAIHKIDAMGNEHDNYSLDYDTSESTSKIIQNGQYYSFYIPVKSVQSFSQLSEIRDYIHHYMTDRLISEHFSNLVDGEHPRYTQRNNKLCVNPYITSAAYGISRISSDNFTVELQKNESSDEEITACKVYINDEKPDQILSRLLKVDTDVSEIMSYGTSFIDLNDSYAEIIQQEEIDSSINSYQLFYRVIDKRYSDISELEQYLRTYYTDSMFNSFCVPGISYWFKEINGVLYSGRVYGKSGNFIGWDHAPAEFTEVTDTSFTARNKYLEMEYENSEDRRTALITCVKESDGWKIDKIAFE